MARLGPTGLVQLVTDIKNWVLSKIPTKVSDLTNDSGFITSNHAHTKSDVTDLFNSANTWSGDNTYSKTITVERNKDSGNFLVLKNTEAELGSIPASITPATIAYRDKNDENLSYMGVYYDTDGSNLFRLYVRNKFTSGAPSTSGSADYTYFGLKLNADKSKEGILKASFRPYDNNSYDLGSSSYQWKSVYANAYYLGTTAFGDIVTHNASEFLTSHQSLSNYVTLNSAQTISGIKTITGGNQGKMVFKNPNYTKGDALESSVTVSRIYFGNSASYDSVNAVLSTDINTSGNSIVELCAINNTSSESTRTSLILTYDKSATRKRLLKSWGDFVPYGDSTYDLGSSSYQWNNIYANQLYLNGTEFKISDIPTKTSDLTNDSGFLTSHQSLSNYVTLDSSQILTATKNFTTNINTSGTSTTSRETWRLVFNKDSADTDSTAAAQIGLVQGANASNFAAILRLANPRANNKPTTGNTGNCWSGIGVYYNYDENKGYPYALNCWDWPASSNSVNELASTSWVRTYCETTKGFLTSHQSLDGYLPLAGGIMTGDLIIKGATLKFSSLDTTEGSTTYRTDTLIKSVSSNTTYGLNVLFGSNGAAVLGAGEGKDSLLTELAGTASEDVYIIADGSIHFHPNANKYANKKTVTLDTSANLSGLATVTATTFSGPLTGNVTGNCSGSSGSCTGNAATATQFSANKAVTLTGDVTGTASSKAGWSVATTLANSGVTAGSYGPSAAVSPAHGGTFSVPYVTVDAKGRVTAASTITITLPSDNNTDTKVTQTVTTGNAYYPVILGNTATATATETSGARFSKGFLVNTRYSTLVLKNTYDSANTKGVRNTATYQNGCIIAQCYDGTEMGRIHCESNKSGYTRTYIRATNYVTSGAISPTGSAVNNGLYLDVKDDGTKLITIDGYWNNNHTPATNNSRTLGTSSLQWKAAYAINFYESGAALSSKYAQITNISTNGIGTTCLLAYFPTGGSDLVLTTGVTKPGTSLYVVYWELESTALLSGNKYYDAYASLVVDKGYAETGTWKLLHSMSCGYTQKAMIGVWVRTA